jgi:hypothetical protein
MVLEDRVLYEYLDGRGVKWREGWENLIEELGELHSLPIMIGMIKPKKMT